MSIHWIPVDNIKTRINLSRMREDLGAIEDLAASIKRHGQIEPIVITTDYELIAGGRRLAACKLLKRDVHCIIRAESTDDLKLRELELEENIQRKDLNFVEKAKLIKEIDTLKKKQLGARSAGRGGTSKGWSQQDTADLLGKSKATISNSIALADAMETFPEIAKAKNEVEARKMLKKIEEALLIQEISKRQKKQENVNYDFAVKAFTIDNVMTAIAGLPNESFDIAEVDSPYGIDLKGQRKTNNRAQLATTKEYTEWSVDKYKEDIAILAIDVYAKLKPDSWCIWWYGQEHYQLVVDMLKAAGFAIDKIPAIWAKGRGQTNQPELYLARTYEVFIVARKGSPVMWKRGKANVFNYGMVPGHIRIHPTEKPIDLLRELLDTFAQDGQEILVPFLGSGNTLRAAYMNGMRGQGFELDENLKTKFLIRVADDIENKVYK